MRTLTAAADFETEKGTKSKKGAQAMKARKGKEIDSPLEAPDEMKSC